MKVSAGGHHVCPAFVLGTRRGDPNCGDQQAFAPSSTWMPGNHRTGTIEKREKRPLYWQYFLYFKVEPWNTFISTNTLSSFPIHEMKRYQLLCVSIRSSIGTTVMFGIFYVRTIYPTVSCMTEDILL